MSTLRTYNLQSIDSGNVNIQLSPNAGAILAGLTTAQSGLHVTDGNVAIGTDDPGQLLTVGAITGGADGNLSVKTNSNNHAIAIEENSGNENYQLGVNSSGDLGFYNSGATVATVTFADNNNVGIGTDNPLNLLDVFQDTGRTRLNRYGHIISQNHNHGTTNYWTFAPRDGGELNIAYGAPNNNANVKGEFVTIDVDGNVSIGTDNPTGTNPARLTVLSDPSTAVSYGSSDAFAVKSKNIDGTGISTIFAIRPFSPSGPISAVGNNPLYNVAINAWVHIDSAGHNCNFLADDSQRTYVGFYTGASVDKMRAGEYTTLNGDGTPTAFGLAQIVCSTNNGLSFNRGAGASNDVSFRFVGKNSHGDDNIIVKFQGDTDNIQIRNQSQGDYMIYNSQQGNSVALYDGSGGVEFRYQNDGTKTFECDSDGAKSPYITNTSATSSGVNIRLHNSILKPQSSTRRLKNNIRNYVGVGLSRIEQMVPRTWEDYVSGETISGFIAEELHDIGFESAIVYREYEGGSEIGIGDTYGSMYGNGSAPITKDGVELDDQVLVIDNIEDRAILAEVVIALKELKAENDSLKSRITTLESN